VLPVVAVAAVASLTDGTDDAVMDPAIDVR